MVYFTILTPTYNRAHTLGRLYKSLTLQTCIDFEWIIVDDGSKDDTQKQVNIFVQAKNSFPIIYLKKENGGKHTAVNYGVKRSSGKFVYIVDSDDSLPPLAIETIYKYVQQIEKDASFAGVSGTISHYNGTPIGSWLSYPTMISNSLDIRFKHHISGDLAEVFRSEILRAFPFPEILEEKFCPEALIWNRIAEKYRLLYFNESIKLCDYLSGGLTDNIVSIRMQSPIASCTYYKELFDSKIPVCFRIKASINYWRFFFCLRKKIFNRYSIFFYCFLPFGFLMHLHDKRIAK